MRHDLFLPGFPVEEGRTVEVTEGLRLIASQGAPAQARRAGELLADLANDVPGASMSAQALIEAYLHDPDLWR